MKHRLKPSQYAVLVAVMLTASIGDGLLKKGMTQVGPVDMQHLGLLWHALFNPYIAVGIVLLIGFFASYMTALSFADLTFVMPATAMGYVSTALISRFWLHEQLSPYRWLGILFIVCGVGFVAGGHFAHRHGRTAYRIGSDGPRSGALMPVSNTGARAWSCIASVALLAIAGEVLVAGAMRKLGDLDIIREKSGLPGAVRAVLSSPVFVIGALCMAFNFFSMLYTLSIVDYSLAGPATASLTYIGNAVAAMLFLRENVDKRRWLAAAFVIVGVVLLSR